jgi:GT2 family glycosyltransferase
MEMKQTLKEAGGRRDTDELPPTLSVIIVTYACRALVLDCLASLEAQRHEVDMEVVVVDNDSPDNTLEAIQESFPWVIALSAGANLGFATANNLALKSVRGRQILLLNPDTVVPAGGLLACIAALESRADVGVLGCKLVQPSGQLDHACKRGFPRPASSLWHFMGLNRLFPRSSRFAAYTAGHIGEDEISTVDAINGAFMLIRREAIEAVGSLDESFWMYGEDLDWCYRFWMAGWKILYWPEIEVMHVKGGSSTKTRSRPANKAFHEAMWLFYKKHYATTHSVWMNTTVWVAVYTKLVISVGRNALRKARLASDR